MGLITEMRDQASSQPTAPSAILTADIAPASWVALVSPFAVLVKAGKGMAEYCT